MVEILRTVADLRARVAEWKAGGASVGVVPTMGALHEGHLSLARAAKAGTDRVIVTIFVNPKQFNNAEDLKKYPRTLEADAALLDSVGVDVIFSPAPEEVYPAGFATTVSVSGVSEPLEGVHRPGHFDGMATVVTKLFGMTRADRAWFGQKDWQQLQVVRRLVADLNLHIEIVGAETVRDADGLALSSRNARLSAAAREIAPSLYWAMVSAAADLRDGDDLEDVLHEAREAVLGAGFDKVEYLDLRTAEMLDPMDRLDGPARLLAAAWLDGVRLIDNISV